MKFIKLQYKDVIKKLLLTQEELTLDHLCEIIMNSFALQQKEKIILKYMVAKFENLTFNYIFRIFRNLKFQSLVIMS